MPCWSHPAGVGKPDTTIDIVEIKCCPDTQPLEQLEKAKTQHSTLKQYKQLLMEHGYKPEKIITVPILVGVSGTIYTLPNTRHRHLKNWV